MGGGGQEGQNRGFFFVTATASVVVKDWDQAEDWGQVPYRRGLIHRAEVQDRLIQIENISIIPQVPVDDEVELFQ